MNAKNINRLYHQHTAVTYYSFHACANGGWMGHQKYPSQKNDSELQFTATVKAPWHIYSITSAEGGPAPMRFVFTKNPLIALDRKVAE